MTNLHGHASHAPSIHISLIKRLKTHILLQLVILFKLVKISAGLTSLDGSIDTSLQPLGDTWLHKVDNITNDAH